MKRLSGFLLVALVVRPSFEPMPFSNRQLVKPPALRPGDTVGIVAPASNIKQSELEAGCSALVRAGLAVGVQATSAPTTIAMPRSATVAGQPAARSRSVERAPGFVAAATRPILRHGVQQ